MAYSFGGTILRAVATFLDGSGNPIFASAADPLPVTIAAAGPDVDVKIAPVSSATVTSVNSANTNTTLLAANTARRKVLITNTDANALRVKLGATASATSFSVAIPANGYWEMPDPPYTGIIDGIWDADGSGAAIITEM